MAWLLLSLAVLATVGGTLVGIVRLSQSIIGPVEWLLRTWLRGAFSGSRRSAWQLPSLFRSASRPQTELLRSTFAAPGNGRWTRVFAADIEGFSVLVSMRPAFLRPNGTEMTLPLPQEDRDVARYVVVCQILVDARDRLPGKAECEASIRMSKLVRSTASFQVVRRLDPTFEKSEEIIGHDALAHALLDGDLRGLLGDGDGLLFKDGLLHLSSPRLLEREGPMEALVQLLRVVRRLERAAGPSGAIDVSKLLEENIRTDTDPVVRARSIDALFALRGAAIEASPAVGAALSDPVAAVRLIAAKNLSGDNFDVVAGIFWDKCLPEGLRLRALKHLARRYEPSRLLEILEYAVKRERGALEQAAVQSVGRLTLKDAIPWLTSLRTPDARLRADVATALADMNEASVEPDLVRLLADPQPEVQIAAADALARVGALQGLSALKPYSSLIVGHPGLKLAAQQAVRRIQARVAQATGSLSVAMDDADGLVSIAEGGPGALSEMTASGL